MLRKLTRRGFLTGGAACVAARAAAGRAPELDQAAISFIQVTDTHVSRRRLYSKRRGYDVPSEESIRRCRAAVKDINECSLPYELVVHTGDLAETRDTTEDYDLAQELLRFRRPAYFIPGNHDVGYSETGKYLPEFEKRFGSSNRSLEPAPGIRFALFDSQPLDPRAPDEDREQAFAQLDRILTPPKPTILFCHVMGLPSFYNNRLYPGWPEATMRRWTERMKKGGVIAVLAGHYHRDEYQWVNGIPFWLAGPVINFWGRQTCYRHWMLANGRLTYRTVYLDI